MLTKKEIKKLSDWEKRNVIAIRACRTITQALEIINKIYQDGFEDGVNEG